MKAKTDGFRWLPSYYEAIRDLPDEERLAIYDAILDFGFGNDPAPLPPLLNGYFSLIKPTLERSIRFERKQRANGEKGGRPSEPKNNLAETQNKPRNNPDETQSDFGENLDIDVDVDVANEIDIDIEKHADKPRRAARFTPPSFEEVQRYCAERRNGVDPQRFVDYYTSNGWKVGRNQMKDWKAAVRTWEGGNRGGRNNDHGNQDPEIPGITRL